MDVWTKPIARLPVRVAGEGGSDHPLRVFRAWLETSARCGGKRAGRAAMTLANYMFEDGGAQATASPCSREASPQGRAARRRSIYLNPDDGDLVRVEAADQHRRSGHAVSTSYAGTTALPIRCLCLSIGGQRRIAGESTFRVPTNTKSSTASGSAPHALLATPTSAASRSRPCRPPYRLRAPALCLR